MNRRFTIKKGDIQPPLQATIFNPDGSPRDVSSDIVTFRMGEPGQALKVNNVAAFIVNGSGGVVEHRWSAGQTDTPGEFRAEFVLNGNETFPKEGYIVVAIDERLE